MRRAGIASADWLPLACDPEIHRKHEIAKQHDVAFVGNIFPGPREELLDLNRRKYRNAFIGHKLRRRLSVADFCRRRQTVNAQKDFSKILSPTGT